MRIEGSPGVMGVHFVWLLPDWAIVKLAIAD